MDDWTSVLGTLDGVGTVGTWVLLGVAIMRGWVVTARELANVAHDRDEWRTESRLKDAQIAEKDVQLGHLKEVGNTVELLARGLQQEIQR